MINKVLIWDCPVRVFHWLMVVMFVMAWMSYDDGRYLDVHVYSGYMLAGLLLFRMLWGVVGSHYARFSEFAYGPRKVVTYLRSLLTHGVQRYVGHNPAGAWAIFTLLALGVVLTVSGVLVLGGEERQGPLAGVITFDQSVFFRRLHGWVAWTMLMLVALHVIGVVVESVLHKENLIGAMFRGTKWVQGESALVAPHKLLGISLLVAVLAAGGVWFGGYLTDADNQPYLPFKGPQLAQNELWSEECGACHLAFHPNLLPSRSWRLMLTEQAEHFDEDLMLDEDAVDELRVFAEANGAEHLQTEAAWRISRSVAPDQVPLRITQTDYWKEKHAQIEDEVWRRQQIKSRLNCAACHKDAERGTFEDAAMKIPANK